MTKPLDAQGTGPGAFEMAYDRFHNVMDLELPTTLKFLETVIRPAKGIVCIPSCGERRGWIPRIPGSGNIPRRFRRSSPP